MSSSTLLTFVAIDHFGMVHTDLKKMEQDSDLIADKLRHSLYRREEALA